MPDTSRIHSPVAALFDMDGVLVDNIAFHVNAWLHFAREHGRPLTKDQYLDHINGRVSADAMAYVFGRQLPADELTAMTEEKESTYRKLYGPHLQPAPGLMAFLDVLKAAGVRLAVGTSAPLSNVQFTLDGLNLRHYFDAVVDATMVSRGKPDPEIYRKAAECVGVEPARCVVFEDAFTGIEAGWRAGMRVIALATTHTPGELTSTGASLIVPDFTGLTVATVQALID